MGRMDSSAVRRVNLQRLIKQEGSLKAVADKAGINYDYLSSIVSANSSRNAGSSLMRRIERAYELEIGSLDLPEPTSISAAMAIDQLPEDDRQQVFDFIKYKIIDAGPLVVNQTTAKHYLEMIDRLKNDMGRLKAESPRKPPRKPRGSA